MLPRNRIPIHPGEILLREYLEPLAITQVAFAKRLSVPVQRINELVRGKRGVTAETAWLLADALNVSPEFWMNLQSGYDLARVRLSEQAAARRAPARVRDVHPPASGYLRVAEPEAPYRSPASGGRGRRKGPKGAPGRGRRQG